MRSIRRALLVRLALGLLALSVVGAVLLYAGVGWLLTRQYDETLEAKLGTFTALVEQEGEDVHLEVVPGSMPEFETDEEPEYLELWSSDGEVLARSPSLAGRDLPRFAGEGGAPLVRDLVLPDGRAGRALGARFTVQDYEAAGPADPGPAEVVVVIARGRAPLDGALETLLAGTAGGTVVLLVLALGVARTVVRRGLLPLDELARRVGAVADPALAEPIPLAGVPAELRPVAEGLNGMLDRIRRAFERERRTTANIAHELRTPVSELVTVAEVALRYPDDPDETTRALAQLHEIGEQMRALIATLLELARVESGRVALEAEPVDLPELVHACWGPLEAGARGRGQRFSGPTGPGPVVRADRAALGILLSNLLANAVEYAPDGDAIRCGVERSGGGCALVVANAARGMAPADLDKLTEPFWRASAARDDRAHAGLGLALAHRLAELLDLELSFALEEGTFRARLGFPAAADRDAPREARRRSA